MLRVWQLGTDYVWRCANLQAARNATIAQQSPAVYIAEFVLGIQYVSSRVRP